MSNFNYVNFIKKVDENIDKMSKEELEKFIKIIAASLSEDKRKNFLNRFDKVKDSCNKVEEDYDNYQHNYDE